MILPSIQMLLNIEMIRDGGSFAAKFRCSDDHEYILFFKLDASEKLDNGKNYQEPVLIDCDPKKRPRDTNKIIYSELGGPPTKISWIQAGAIMQEVTRFNSVLSELQTKWLDRMVSIAANNGVAVRPD